MRTRVTSGIVVAVLAAAAWWLPDLRRALIFDITWWDAAPVDPAPIPPATGPSLGPTPRTRVVLIDGLAEEVAQVLPAWSAVCKRGITMRVDVGFPTISLPVQATLWTGLTQQQTGIVSRNGSVRAGSYGRPIVPPLDRHGIPGQIPGSIAIAEDHGWIVRSLGFARFLPPADPLDDTKDANPEPWKAQWVPEALAAIATDAPLVFVHILRVDTAGHKHGLGAEYRTTASEADAILAQLLEADPTARWFVLSDHGHLPTGGHGGEERAIRQVQGCIAGPGVLTGTADLVHMVDVARTLADSTGAILDREARGRPISAALGAPLGPDQAVPPVELGRGVIAMFLLVVGLGLSTWGVRRWWLAPWWFVLACASLYLVRGEPTLSTAMTYRGDGRLLYTAWLPALVPALIATWIGVGRTTLARVLVAQLALPVLATAAAIAAAGAWPVVFGTDLAPVTPRYTAWMLALVLMVAHGAAAVGLAVLARLVRPGFDRLVRWAFRRTGPATGA
jgi:hypothetical protein